MGATTPKECIIVVLCSWAAVGLGQVREVYGRGVWCFSKLVIQHYVYMYWSFMQKSLGARIGS